MSLCVRAVSLLCAAALLAACASSGGKGAAAGLVFHGEQVALPGFSYDTDWQPAGSPVQLKVVLTTAGKLSADARATADTATDPPTLAPIAGSGSFAMDAHLKLVVSMKISVTGAEFEGPLAGVPDIDLAFGGTAPFDPFALTGSPAGLTVDVPETELVTIPLAGALSGIPGVEGNLVLHALGTLQSDFHGTCATTAGDLAQYTGETTTSGTLTLRPTVVLSINPGGLIALYDNTIGPLDLAVPVPATTAPVDLGVLSLSTATAAPAGSVGPCVAPPPDRDVVGPADGVTADDTTTVPAVCGNGRGEGGEDCDGADLKGQTCATKGYTGGALACTAACRFDVSGCQGTPAVCGNGAAEGGEQCDGADLKGQTCAALGYAGGTLACTANCLFDSHACTGSAPVCGNGVAEGNEACDGADLKGQTCESEGFSGGTLTCKANCRFDASGCTGTPVCGNGAVERGEQCDGANLNGRSCTGLGFQGGTLTCTASCRLDTGACTGAGVVCGNGVVDAGEQCDGGELLGASCVGLGFASGRLVCGATCQYDTSGCVQRTTCGNGAVDSGEDCDGSNLNGASCTSLGFLRGSLTCSTSCKFDRSACQAAATCGDGFRDAGEPCDGADLNGATCGTLGWTQGALVCTAACQLDTSGCWTCGNGAAEAQEACDRQDLRGATCLDYGWKGGALVCTQGCTLDDSACCSDDGYEPNDIKAQASVLPNISDDDADATSLTAVLLESSGDWYAVHIEDTFGHDLNPWAGVSAPEGEAIRVCAYYYCDGDNPETAAPNDQICFSVGSAGTDSRPLASADCSGSDDSGTLYIWVTLDAGATGSCAPYTLQYGG